MKICLRILLLLPLLASSQHKAYLLDGTCFRGQVTRDGNSYMIRLETGENIRLGKKKLMMIIFERDSVELFNEPRQDIVHFNDPVIEDSTRKVLNGGLPGSYVSLNSIAVCNADFSLFIEQELPSRRLAFGVMAAYNISPYAGPFNAFIDILPAGKKLYDLGAYAKFYLTRNRCNTRFFLGLMLKYTALTFSEISEERRVVNGMTFVSFKYRPATGSQLATLITCGFHTRIKGNLYITPMIGLGGFNLKDAYKRQFNYSLSSAGPGLPLPQQTFLPKAYLALNIGLEL